MDLHSTQLLRTPTKHSWSVSGAADYLWAKVTDGMSSWSPLRAICRQKILSILNTFTVGRLIVVTSSGKYEFGEANPAVYDGLDVKLDVVLFVKSEDFWTRVALFTDLGLAEAYMYGEVECDDMSSLLKIFILNRSKIEAIDSLVSSVLSLGRKLTAYKFLGSLSNSRANISAHYDLGNDMFAGFLSKDMNYSSALFLDYNQDLKGRIAGGVIESLEDAQTRKMRMLMSKLNVRPGDRLLEIGTGWGSLSILIANQVDCKIDTVTLSVNQCMMARERIKEAGLSDRITVHNFDFRECMSKPEWRQAFDRFVSVEMIENIGREYIEDFWKVADWALKPAESVGVVQVISMPEERIPNYNSNPDFVQKWIFPGCYIPSLFYLMETMHKGSAGRLTVDSVLNIGPHYARTLRTWKKKFLANWDKVIAPDLVSRNELTQEDLEAFKKKWIYYFDYCEAGFATRNLGDHVITFTRQGHVAFGCSVDPTLY